MPEDHYAPDQEIIRAAYAERVKDAFKVFAENLGMGEKEQTVRERFMRALEMSRKARDLALQAVAGINVVEPATAASRIDAPAQAAALSIEEQAMIDQAVSGTTGHRAPPPQQMGNYRR